MNTGPDPIDRHARTLHASALAHTSPEVLRRLRQARQAATAPAASPPASAWLRRGGWLAGTACAAVLAVAVGLRLGDAPMPATAPTLTTAMPGIAEDTEVSMVEPLQEDPGFYLWLASEAPALAME